MTTAQRGGMAETEDLKTEANYSSGTTFQLQGEDHTLANAVRFMLNKSPHVDFCGYSIPHPSEPVVNIRVQTTGRISAQQALRRALSDLKDLCVEVKEQYVGATEEADRNMQTD